jgi:nicotinamide-nucleotide amidase
MKFLMTENVIPYLREHFNLGSGIIKARVLRTAGIGESLLDSQIGSELLEGNNPTVGLAAHTGQVDIRITAKADSEAQADEMIAVVEEELRSKIGRFIFGVDQDQIEVILTKILSDGHTSIAISETGIGNPISSLLTSVPNSQEIVTGIERFETPITLRTANTIDAEVNIRELAERTASEICKRYNTSAAIAVVSEPTMGEFHADTESGTAIAVCLNGKTCSRIFGFGGQTDIAQNWVSTWSMSTLWQMLQE